MGMIFLILILFVLLLIGVPVGFALGGATMIILYYFTNMDMVIVGQYAFSGVNSFTLLAIPFFMLAGIIMSRGGIASRIVDFAFSLIGFVTGALGAVSIVACMFFGALSGSGMATTSAIGSMMIPEMDKSGYNRAYATTLVCFGGIVGPIIPPSLAFVMYGSVAGVSIADLFIAGILPGIMIGLILIATNYLLCRKYKFGLKEENLKEMPLGEFIIARIKSIITTGKDGFWALLSPVIILGGIYSGIFTPTEAACVSVVYSIIISIFVYKTLTLKGLYGVLLESATLNGITSFLLSYSTVFSAYLAYASIPSLVMDFLSRFAPNEFILLLLINLILLLMGCFLDMVPAIIIMAPILLPTVAAFGIDPVHFGVIMSINLSIGLCTPPYGCNLFVGCAVGGIKMDAMFRYIWPFFIAVLVSLALVTYIPAISLILLK